MPRYYIFEHGPRRMICDSHTDKAILGLEMGISEPAASCIANICLRALNEAHAEAARTVQQLEVFFGVSFDPKNK